MWLNPEKLNKNRLELSEKRRLEDMYSQDFQDFLRKDINEKTVLLQMYATVTLTEKVAIYLVFILHR